MDSLSETPSDVVTERESMKSHYLFNTVRLLVVCAAFTFLISSARAQQSIALHSFGAFTNFSQTNYDGGDPTGNLLLIGTNLYGTAASGGPYSQGTLFAISTN